MSIQALSAVFELVDPRLTVAQRFVLVAYANHANRYGQHSYPGRATVASETSLSEPSVSRATKALIEFGYLQVQTRPGRDPVTKRFTGSVVYNVILPGLPAVQQAELPLQDSPPENGAASHPETRSRDHSDTRPGDQPVAQPGYQAGDQTGYHSDTGTVEPLTAETVNGFLLFEAKNEELVGRLREKGHIQ